MGRGEGGKKIRKRKRKKRRKTFLQSKLNKFYSQTPDGFLFNMNYKERSQNQIQIICCFDYFICKQ